MKKFPAWLDILCACAFLLVLLWTATTERSSTATLLTAFACAFILYLFMVSQRHHWRWWLFTGIAARCILLMVFPQLSDDIYRFFWDGNLIVLGFNPHENPPSAYVDSVSLPAEVASIYPYLNSQGYYTVYPIVCQAVFAMSAWISGADVGAFALVLKMIVLLFECGSLSILLTLLRHEHREAAITLYAVNPLVILELTGNAHPEAIMLFFLLMMYALLRKGRVFLSATTFTLAIATKLIPLLILPFLIRRMAWKKFWIFSIITFILSILFFIPIVVTSNAQGFLSSVALYFRQFEFNAAIYAVVKWCTVMIQGHHEISISGPILALATLLLLAMYSGTEIRPSVRNLPIAMLFALSLYFLFATTVHPWYICPLIALAALTGFWFPLIWSGLIFASYVAYRTAPPDEVWWITTVEYAVVVGWCLYELYRRRWLKNADVGDLKNKSDQRMTLTAFDLFSDNLRKINKSKDHAPS